MKFFHLRISKDGLYHRARKPEKELAAFGGMTIGYVPVDKERTKLLVVFSRCSERDRFNRKLALQICLGRFTKGKYIEVNRPQEKDLYEVLINAATAHEQTIETQRKKLGIKKAAI